MNKIIKKVLIIISIIIAIYLILILIAYSKISFNISIEYLITTIWAITAFYIWYKRYVREKDLDILERYWYKYDKINDCNKIIDKKINKKYYKQLINLWSEEVWLYKSKYITENLWLRIKHKIELRISIIIKDVVDWKITQDELIEIFKVDDLTYYNLHTGNFILKILNEIKNDYEDFVKNDSPSDDVDDIIKEHIKVIDWLKLWLSFALECSKKR